MAKYWWVIIWLSSGIPSRCTKHTLTSSHRRSVLFFSFFFFLYSLAAVSTPSLQVSWSSSLSVVMITKIIIDNTAQTYPASMCWFLYWPWSADVIFPAFFYLHDFDVCACARLCSWLPRLCVSHYFTTLWSRVSHRPPSMSPSLFSLSLLPSLSPSVSLLLSLPYPSLSLSSSLHLYSALQPQLLPSQLSAVGWSPCCTWHVLWDPGATLDVRGPGRPPPRQAPAQARLPWPGGAESRMRGGLWAGGRPAEFLGVKRWLIVRPTEQEIEEDVSGRGEEILRKGTDVLLKQIYVTFRANLGKDKYQYPSLGSKRQYLRTRECDSTDSFLQSHCVALRLTVSKES